MRGSFILHLDPSEGLINICAVASYQYNVLHGSVSNEVEKVYTSCSDVVRMARATALSEVPVHQVMK